jgi:mannose-6-phosphate isomerase-like protein (cupin superfamily)
MTSEPIILDQSAVPLETWSDPVRGVVAFRTLVGDGTTATDSLTAGVTEMGPGGWLGHHRHEPAEIYYVLEGTGTVVLAGQEHPVHAGSSVFIPGDVEHGIRNTGPGQLRFFYAFAVGSFADIAYRFSAEGD